ERADQITHRARKQRRASEVSKLDLSISRALRLTIFVALSLCALSVAAQEPGATPPPPAPPRSPQIPRPVERTLANGLRVIVVERKNMPLVSAALYIKNGGEIDPPQLSGVADMTASLLT